MNGHLLDPSHLFQNLAPLIVSFLNCIFSLPSCSHFFQFCGQVWCGISYVKIQQNCSQAQNSYRCWKGTRVRALDVETPGQRKWRPLNVPRQRPWSVALICLQASSHMSFLAACSGINESRYTFNSNDVSPTTRPASKEWNNKLHREIKWAKGSPCSLQGQNQLWAIPSIHLWLPLPTSPSWSRLKVWLQSSIRGTQF